MAGNNACVIDHISHTMPAYIDAVNDIVERVILIDAHHVEGRLSSFFYRHPHSNPQTILEFCGCICG